ncbi:hypothetical protein [Oceanobacillus locisalsi]|uniref:Signal transduction histidine kinase subgroup 3 dimerisation and phosphoacceptor domain-containing protein n=1 Tax=Oceanobacillus locisalsi TaxID=546107 RepID=A0ABW3NKM8_9BACI
MINLCFLFSVICLELFSILWVKNEPATIITISTFYFSINIFIPLVKVVFFLFKNKGKQDKTFLIWMLLIPTIAFFPFLFLFLLPFLVNHTWINPYITAWAFFILPVGYTYLILTQKLININFILNRTLYYSGLAFIPSSFLIFVLFLLHPERNLDYLIQIFIILFLFNVMFFFIKEQIDFKLRNSLFRGKNNIVQSVERLVRDLENCRTKKDLNNVIRSEIEKQFNMVDVSIIKYNFPEGKLEEEYLIGNNTFENIPIKLIENQKNKIMIDYENTIGIFLSEHPHVITYLWIGNHKKNIRFNIHDKSWLLVFGSYLRFSYENIRMNEESVMQLITDTQDITSASSRFLFHFAETERRRLSEDIHNTFLQDQIYIYRELELLAAKNNQAELLKLKDNLKHVIDKTRQTCNEIKPFTLSSKGLPFSLNELFHRIQQRAAFQLSYEIDIFTERFDHYEKSILIYRTITSVA